jgi:hypothetical protein
MQKADEDANLELDFAEFSRYMQKHERQLRLAFSDLDRNKDGKCIIIIECSDQCYINAFTLKSLS